MLLSFAQTFGCREHVERIISIRFKKLKKEISPNYLLTLASIYQYSPLEIKEKTFLKMDKLTNKFLKLTKLPLKKTSLISDDFVNLKGDSNFVVWNFVRSLKVHII